MESESAVAAILAAANRFSNKTTVENELNLKGTSGTGVNPISGKQQNLGAGSLVLPYIESSKGDYTAKLQQQQRQLGISPRVGKKTQRQTIPGYPYL